MSVAAATEADLSAFMAFYDETCDDAFGLACLYTGNSQAASDVVVKAYVQTWQRAEPRPRSLFCAIRAEAISRNN